MAEEQSPTEDDLYEGVGSEEDIYGELDVRGAAPTKEEIEAASRGATGRGYYGDDGFLEGGRDQSGYTWGDYQEDLKEINIRAKEAAARREAGLSDDRLFGYAERLKDIAEGRRKTEGQIDAEEKLDILTKAQRGRAMGYGGFNAAELLQKAGRSAQQAELGGESAIAEAVKQASRAADDELEQLLIASKQRAEDRAFAMQQLTFQEAQAGGALWSNVLSGVLGAVGSVVGAAVGGPAGAVIGGTIGAGTGKAGQYLG